MRARPVAGAMAYVHRHGSQLARLADLDPMMLSRQVTGSKPMARLPREPHSEDGRAHCLRLTEGAQPRLKTMWQLAYRIGAATLAGTERSQFNALLQRLLPTSKPSSPNIHDTADPRTAAPWYSTSWGRPPKAPERDGGECPSTASFERYAVTTRACRTPGRASTPAASCHDAAEISGRSVRAPETPTRWRGW